MYIVANLFLNKFLNFAAQKCNYNFWIVAAIGMQVAMNNLTLSVYTHEGFRAPPTSGMGGAAVRKIVVLYPSWF